MSEKSSPTRVRRTLFSRLRVFATAILCGVGVELSSLSTTEGQVTVNDDSPFGMFNIPTYTLGGMQVWTDHVHFRGWRIQQHAVSKHFRLIDPRNIRRAWGSLAQCERQLEAIKSEQGLAPPSGRILVLIHGLGRTRNSMDEFAETLQADREYEVINFSYASTRASLDEHAEALKRVIDHIPAECEIDVVAHSLGNLVLRRYFFHRDRASDQASQARIHRIVMLGPPNNGAEMARKLRRTGLLGLVLGKSAVQLADLKTSAESLELAVPTCEFGIVAGDGGSAPVSNPLLVNNNDLLVEVDETRLAGAADFVVLSVSHTFLVSDKKVQQVAKQFLANGYFVSPESRNALPVTNSTGTTRESDRR